MSVDIKGKQDNIGQQAQRTYGSDHLAVVHKIGKKIAERIGGELDKIYYDKAQQWSYQTEGKAQAEVIFFKKKWY